MGNRKYSLHSDLPDLKGVSLVQSGRTYGVIFGSSLAMAKIKIGNFSSQKNDNPIHSSSFELSLNISPLQLISKMDRKIEPYLVTSIETTNVYSSGTYTQSTVFQKNTNVPPPCSCTCDSTNTNGSGSPIQHIDPRGTTSPDNAPAPYSGTFGSTRLNLGVGINVHLSKGSLFLNFFAEMKYGLAVGTTSSTQALLYTYALNQVVVNSGVSIGVSKNRSQGRLRRNRFR